LGTGARWLCGHLLTDGVFATCLDKMMATSKTIALAPRLLLAPSRLDLAAVAVLCPDRRITLPARSRNLVAGIHGHHRADGPAAADGEDAPDADRGTGRRRHRNVVLQPAAALGLFAGIFAGIGAGLAADHWHEKRNQRNERRLRHFAVAGLHLIGLATTLPRASFIVLGNRVVLPSVVQRALRYAPAAALAAIVVPDVLVVAARSRPSTQARRRRCRGSRHPALAQPLAAVHRRHGRAAGAAHGAWLVAQKKGG
jgi:hypothetical protein